MEDSFSKNVAAMDEPSMFELSSDKDNHSYRFLWLRSFHEPVSVRIKIHSNGAGTLYVKMCDHNAWHGPNTKMEDKTNTKIEDRTVDLTKDAVDAIMEKLNDAEYWDMPAHRVTFGLDGASWLVEGVMSGQYRVVLRWSPVEGAYRELGLHFLKLSGLEVEPIY
jgi:hypothetical protein